MTRRALSSPRFWTRLFRGVRPQQPQAKPNPSFQLEKLEDRLVPDAQPISILFTPFSYLDSISSSSQGIELGTPAINSPSAGSTTSASPSGSLAAASNLATSGSNPGASSLTQTSLGSSLPASATSSTPSTSTSSYQVTPTAPTPGSPPASATTPLSPSASMPASSSAATTALTSPVTPPTTQTVTSSTAGSSGTYSPMGAPSGGSGSSGGTYSPPTPPPGGTTPGTGGTTPGTGGTTPGTGGTTPGTGGTTPGSGGTSGSGASAGPTITVTSGNFERHYTHQGTKNQAEFYLDVTIVGSFTPSGTGLLETASIQYSTWRKDNGIFTFQSLNQSATVTQTITAGANGYTFFGLEDEDGPTGYDWSSFNYQPTEWTNVTWAETIKYKALGNYDTEDGDHYQFASRAEVADNFTTTTTWTSSSPTTLAGTSQSVKTGASSWLSDWVVTDNTANFPNPTAYPNQDPRNNQFVADAAPAASTHFYARSWDYGTGTDSTTKSTVFDGTKVAISSSATIVSGYSSQNGYRYYDQNSKTSNWTETIDNDDSGDDGVINPGQGGSNNQTTITGQDNLTWLYDFTGTGTTSGNQTTNLTGVHTSTPVGTMNETFSATNTTIKAKVELSDQYQISDGTTQVTGTLSLKSSVASGAWDQTDGTGNYVFDTAHPGSLSGTATPGSGTITFQSKSGGTISSQVSDNYTFSSQLLDDANAKVGTASGTSNFSASDSTIYASKSSGTWNLGTDTGTVHNTEDDTSSGNSTIAVTTNAIYTDGSLTYHSGWSSADQSSSKSTTTIDGSFDADGYPILATADLQDDTTITTTAYSAWENGVISANDADGVGKVNQTFSTNISNTTPLVDKSSETYHLVMTTTTESSGQGSQGGNSQPTQPAGGGSGGSGGSTSGDKTTKLTAGSLVFRYESSGTLQVQSTFGMNFTAAIRDDATGSSGSGSGGGSGTGAKVGVTTGQISSNATDTVQSSSLTTGSWDLVADKGTVHDVSSYAGSGTSTLSVALNANWDDGSIVYHTDNATSDKSAYSGISTLDGSFDSEGTPILATLDGSDSLTITTTAYAAHENSVIHTSADQGQTTLDETFGSTTVNLTDLVETSGDSYHLVFDAAAAGSGNAGDSGEDSDFSMGMLPTSGTWGFSSSSTGTTKIDSNINQSTTSLLVAPPSGSAGGGSGSGSRVGTAISHDSATSTDTVQATATTSGTWNVASSTTSTSETSSYSGTGASTDSSSYDAVKDDGSLIYHGDTATTANHVYSGNSKLEGTFNRLGAPIAANLDISSKVTRTTTSFTVNENGTIHTTLDNGATSLTETFSVGLANSAPMVSKSSEVYHLEYAGSSSQPGPGGGTNGAGTQLWIPSGVDLADQIPKSGETRPTVATVSFQYDTTGLVHENQSSAGSFSTKLVNASQTKIGQSSGTYASSSKMDSSKTTSLGGTWDLLADKGTVHNFEIYDTGENYSTNVTNRYELTQGGMVYDSGSSSKAQHSFHAESKIDGFFNSEGKQTSGTSHSQHSQTTNTSELNSWESYQATGQPTWTKSQTGDRIDDDHATLDFVFASDGKASGTSTGGGHSVVHTHDLSSWVGTQFVFDSSNTGGSTANQIGTITANDHGDDSQTVIGDASWNLMYADDVPSGDRASTVQLSGTTLWTTDHTLILNQNGHTEYKTIGQDKTALTGTDVILFHDADNKITGSRHMSVANQESHQLTIDGTGLGIGFEGASGDWKYHYQSLDLVDDTDTKDFSLINAAWAETNHTFRTDHQGSSSWTLTQGQSYNTAPNPMNGFWQTQISNLSMGGSNSYHDLKWGDSNNYQFNQNRNGTYNKNSNGSGGYGFGGGGSSGTSASNSVETSSFHDNRSGSTVNGITTYTSVDIASLAEKTSWNESSDKNGQTVQSIRSDDWSRDELTILGNSNSLTTTKTNAFNRIQTYAYSGTGTLPPGGTSTQTGNQTTSNTATGQGVNAALGVNAINNNSGKPGSNPPTQNYVDANANSYRNGGARLPYVGTAPNGFPMPSTPINLLAVMRNNPEAWGEIRDTFGIKEYSDYALSITAFVYDRLTPIGVWGRNSVDFNRKYTSSEIAAMLGAARKRFADEIAMESGNGKKDYIDKFDGLMAG